MSEPDRLPEPVGAPAAGSGSQAMSAPPAASAPPDQARSAVFRALLLVQVAAAGFFGLVPFAVPDAFASVFGYPGAETFLYRLAGAATTGYAVVALLALFRPRWATFRIPLIATLTFNLGAVTAALLSADDGEFSGLAAFILVAAAAFAAASSYWLYRDEGPRADGPPVEEGFRLTLIAATLVAAAFGLLPLLMTNTFAQFFGLASLPLGGGSSDFFIYRLAGAATLGYSVAGLSQLLSGRWAEIRLQIVGAITFNALGAISAAIYLANGGRSLLGILVLLAGGFFTLALTWWSARAAT